MSDIVKRLRLCLRFNEPNSSESEIELVAREAADEIERLRAENAELRRDILNFPNLTAMREAMITTADENAALLARIYKLNALVEVCDELCTALDDGADDIGGSRPLSDIFIDLGHATDAAMEGTL